MSGKIIKRHIYWDLKDNPLYSSTERKAKIAGRPLVKLDVYAFFELTKRQAVSEHRRVDIKRSHLEKISSKILKSPEGCIKLEPEILSLSEVIAKQNDTSNGFKVIGRLCMEKWEELQEKVQSSKLRSGMKPWDARKQSLIIELTQSAPDVEPTLKKLRLI